MMVLWWFCQGWQCLKIGLEGATVSASNSFCSAQCDADVLVSRLGQTQECENDSLFRRTTSARRASSRQTTPCTRLLGRTSACEGASVCSHLKHANASNERERTLSLFVAEERGSLRPLVPPQEGVSDPFSHRKRKKPRTSQNPLSEKPLSPTHDK